MDDDRFTAHLHVASHHLAVGVPVTFEKDVATTNQGAEVHAGEPDVGAEESDYENRPLELHHGSRSRR